MTPLKLGNLLLPSNVIYSPLAGCSDLPFRRMVAKYKPGLMFCEMVKVEALLRNDKNTFRLLDYLPEMRPIGAQLCGSKSGLLKEGAKIIEDLGFDVLDLNCGCPVDKVTKDGSGSGMLKHPEIIGESLAEMISAVKIPVTIKIRVGIDESCINATQITKIAEKAGAKAIFVHGRTRKQGYKGPSNWNHIKECVEVAGAIKVIGNGDIFKAMDAIDMIRQTSCDGVLVSRGTMGQPWIAQEIYKAMAMKDLFEYTIEDQKQHLLEHFRYTLDYRNERRTLIDMRRVGCWYFKPGFKTREFRGQISRVQKLEDVENLIFSFTD